MNFEWNLKIITIAGSMVLFFFDLEVSLVLKFLREGIFWQMDFSYDFLYNIIILLST